MGREVGALCSTYSSSLMLLSEIYFFLLCVVTSTLCVINQLRLLVGPESGDQLSFFKFFSLYRPHVAKTEPPGAEWPLARGTGNAETVSVKVHQLILSYRRCAGLTGVRLFPHSFIHP